MKSSLIWRFIVIIVVIGAWTWSLFPLRDKDFFATFEEMAASNIQDYEQALGQAETEEEKQRYRRLLDDYERIMKEAEELVQEDNDVAAPSVALAQAAQGTDERPGVLLHNYVTVPTIPEAANSTVISRVRQKAAGRIRLGLDLMGGTEFVIGFDPEAEDFPEDRSVANVRGDIVEIMRNRLDNLGVVEPEIRAADESSVSVEMPAISEDRKAEIRETLRQPAKLTFHLVHEENKSLVEKYRQYQEGERDVFDLDPRWKRVQMINELPDGRIQKDNLFITRRPSRVKGGDVIRAYPQAKETGGFQVNLEFNSEGRKNFAQVTSENVGRRLAIVLDGTVYSAPVIQNAITQGTAQITGNFGPEEANRLASVIASGNLPVDIEIDSEFDTDPSLGADSIRSGILAAIIGLALVMLFMIAYYRISGVIAVVALIADMVLVVGTLALLGATLTLPGIAGIILTIGMAVDANVLIFERIREELDNKKSLGNAINAGYRRAFSTIFDANVTTFISALVLLRFGTGSIRGFAVTIGIGVVASMFIALFMTRVFFDLMLYYGRLKKLGMAVIVRNTSIPFLEFRKTAAFISVFLVVLCLAWSGIKGADVFSVDFVGGTSVSFRIEESEGQEAPSVKEIREALAGKSSRVGYKYAGPAEAPQLEIVFPEEEEGGDPVMTVEELGELLRAEFGGVEFEHLKKIKVGSLVGEQFRNAGIIAAVLVAVAIIIYISFRFEFAYAMASVIALIHDVIIAGGVYVLLGRQISLPVVAALLTIMGYSLNDTIVLFDRIREDITLYRNKTYQQLINISINQVLSRTVLTSLTTLLVVLSLFIFGGGAVNDFALVMLLGIIIGTYSSIFIAGAFVAVWHKPSNVPEDSARKSTQSGTGVAGKAG